jgi:cell division protein FtsI/penicillin-binding protein 2
MVMPSDEGSHADHRRLNLLVWCLIFGFTVIVAQLIHYQIIRHSELKAKAEEQHTWNKPLPSTRGNIVDTHHHILACNVVQWDISVSPPLIDDPEGLADELSLLLGMPREKVYAALTADVGWVQLARFVPHEVGEKILALQNPGITCEPRPQRVYPESLLTSHVLGIVTIEGDGFYGVEGYHDSQLRGLDGQETIEQDPAAGKLPHAPLYYNPPKPGTDLVLTLDRSIQYIVQQELQQAISRYGAESGTVIVMDPRTGAILANVSYPAYDPNDFLSADLDSLADPSVSSMWEPGSIFKIITWAAGLDSGTIYPTTTFYDNGAMEVGGRVIQNWDRQGHGLVTMRDGLVKSLNTVAAYISTSMGKDRFYNYLQRFGVGHLTGIDLSSEGPGMVKRPGDPDWFPSELGTNSFGQGVAVTPMQMITAVAAVANRGMLMEPYIVHQFISTDPINERERVVQVEPMIVRLAISQDTAETLTQLLVEVIEQGATEAQVPGYRIAGKTGTAQIPTAYGYHPIDTIASFVGFAPADDPQFIVLVKLDKPQTSPWGSHTAAPTFRAIAEKLFVYMQIPPDEIRLAEHGQEQEP